MERSKLVSLKLRNLGCVGPEGLEVALDNIVCLVGRNNCGKSTVLRAYELAQGSKALAATDPCQWTPENDFPEVEMCVHIPDSVENIDAKWKHEKDGLKLVRSRWQWRSVGEKPERKTWDPQANNGKGDWAEDGKAGGADNVFKSRLPQPIRVDALQEASAEQQALLKLVTEPIAGELRKLQSTEGSVLKNAIDAVLSATTEPVAQYQQLIDSTGQDVRNGFKQVFPSLDVEIKVAIDPPQMDLAKALAAGSSIRFLEGVADTSLDQQGMGARRAMFWTLLQVRNALARKRDAELERNKQLKKLSSDLEKEQQKASRKDDKIEELEQRIKSIQACAAPEESVAFPVYMLLIDEPENCLHPMAVRAARNHLYSLANDDNWQVMLTTHSPYFIDPLEDHTTIVRLERDGRCTTPRTFRTDTAQFSTEDRQNLRALLQLDTNLSEMFFGSYPIIVEGDTEVAAFIASILQSDEGLSTKVSIVPARGKALIAPLVQLLTHFGVPFGVIHDTDSPRRRDNKRNGAWTENSKIAEAIAHARKAGIAVRHRVSIPDFERRLGGFEEEKDKPILAFRRLQEDEQLQQEVRQLFMDLRSGLQQPFEPLSDNASSESVCAAIKDAVQRWAESNALEDVRFQFFEDDSKAQAASA